MLTMEQASAEFFNWLERSEIPAEGSSVYWSAFLAGIDAALIAEGKLPPRTTEYDEYDEYDEFVLE